MHKFVVLILFLPSLSWAMPPSLSSRGEPELRVCTQNLHNFGEPNDKKKRRAVKQSTALRHLIERIKEARCDVIAAQEVYGETKREAQGNIEKASKALSTNGRNYIGIVGDTRDGRIRNGFIYETSIGEVLKIKSFARRSVPKLQPLGPVRYFARGPLLLRLQVPSQEGARVVSLFSIHFKSKANSWKDPTKTKFETLRMEMAEEMRELVQEEQQEIGKEGVVLVLGDRNSGINSATANILEGENLLEDFLSANCSLTRELEPKCLKQVKRSLQLQGIVEARFGKLITKNLLGSYRYKSKYYLLDEILISSDNFWMVRDKKGEVVAGMVGKFGRGSDHMLLFTDLNW